MDLTKLTITGWQKFMSFIGNIATAQTAKALGKYNEALNNQQSAFLKKKEAAQTKVYNSIERPRFKDQQEQQFSKFFPH